MDGLGEHKALVCEATLALVEQIVDRIVVLCALLLQPFNSTSTHFWVVLREVLPLICEHSASPQRFLYARMQFLLSFNVFWHKCLFYCSLHVDYIFVSLS